MKETTYLSIKPWVDRFPEVFKLTDDIAIKLGEGYQKYTIYPEAKNIWKTFELCPYDKMKVIFLSLDPYPGEFTYNNKKLPYAQGIAFSNPPEAQALAPSLQQIKNSVIESDYLFLDQTLENWCRVGCLMLNVSLTLRKSETGSHLKLWEPFTTALLKELGSINGTIFVLLGTEAQKYEKYINKEVCHIIKASHPASAVYKGGVWDYNDIWNKVNNILEGLYGERIIW